MRCLVLVWMDLGWSEREGIAGELPLMKSFTDTHLSTNSCSEIHCLVLPFLRARLDQLIQLEGQSTTPIPI